MDAGSDTTAIALTSVMYRLLKAPSALKHLREEIDAALLNTNSSIATYAQVKNLPYLRACLDESLRLSPPVAFGLNRKTPSGGTTIDGHQVAGGMTVGVPAYTAHRNSALFPEPEAFHPERWIGEDAKRAQASFIPFSTGSRGCIGRHISHMEQSMLLATLVHRYDFSFSHEGWELEWEEAFNLWPGSMPLMIRARYDIT